MKYIFKLWISNEKNRYSYPIYRAVLALTDHSAYQKIVEDAYRILADGDSLCEIKMIEIREE